jgi:hypothetical protein
MTVPARNAMSHYLKDLKQALHSALKAERQDALRDAEEFLGNEISSPEVERLTTEQEVYTHFNTHYGLPGQVAAEYLQSPVVDSRRMRISNRWKSIVAASLLLMALVSGACFAMLREPPKLSPFTKIDFNGDSITVVFDGSTYEWLAINDTPVSLLITSSKKQFQHRWKKRIAEDLVEVMWGMGESSGKTVKLRLRNPETNTETVIASAPMTYENRMAVWQAQVADEVSSARRAQLDTVTHFQESLRDRWAYYPLAASKIDAALISLREKIASKSGDVDLALEFQKIIALGIDGHAGVQRWNVSGRRLPFLIEPVGNRFVAFLPDRSGFVNPAHPFIESIEGLSLDEWCEAAASLEAKGSPQFMKRQALRHLRAIDHWRRELGMTVSKTFRVQLASADKEHAIEKTLTTSDQQPIYGIWPRRESQLLDGNIGYLRLKSMDHQAESDILKLMSMFKDSKGLIVDVRGNGGGSRAALRLFFSYLMAPDDKPRVVNCAKYRLYPDFGVDHLEARFMYRANAPHWTASEQAMIVSFQKLFRPQWQPSDKDFSDWHYMVLNRLDNAAVYHYSQPVVVLMDAKCFSATDIFLAGLKGWRNVTLLGTPSSGGSARKVSFDLPGIRIRTSLASMASFQPNGELYDGNGVMPDVMVKPTAEYFIGQSEYALEAARKILSSQDLE